LRGVASASLCALLALLTLWAAPGQAADRHDFLFQFNEVPAVGPHGEPVAQPGPLRQASAMTVDGGEVYVDEGQAEQFRLNKFDAATGAFTAQFPAVPAPLVYLRQGVAVGHAGGQAQVYVGGDELTEGTNGIVAVFNAAGTRQAVWTGAGRPSKERFRCFECQASGSVALDNSGLGWAAGDVYVADPENAVVDVFEPETGGGEKFVAELKGISPSEPFSKPYKLAVSTVNGDVLVADQGHGVDIFKPAAIAGQYEFAGKLVLPGGVTIRTVTSIAADDGEGNIYVVGSEIQEGGESVAAQVFEFNAAGEYKGRIGHPFFEERNLRPTSVAADPITHRVYVGTNRIEIESAEVFVFGPNIVVPDVRTASSSNIATTSATLNGTVNLDKAGSASCQFEWGTSTAFGEVAPCPAKVEGEGNIPVSVQLSGLQPDTTYYYRLQATNANGTNPGEPSDDQQFTTLGPGLRDASASEVASTSATLNAAINPNKTSTRYYFQYGKSSQYESAIPLAPGDSLGSGTGDVQVSNHLQGLAPATIYHYRLIVVSELEVEGTLQPVTFPGADHTFTTQPPGGESSLPDNRQWELVSPAGKHGGLISGPQYPDVVKRVSMSGNAMTYLSNEPPEAGSAQGNINSVQILSTRGSAGWSSQNLALPHKNATNVTGAEAAVEYRFFSDDLSLSLVRPFEMKFLSLSPQVFPPDTEPTFYVRHNSTCESVPTSCFEPLVTGAPGYADTPAGMSAFGEKAQFVGATPDLAHVLLQGSGGGESELYEWSANGPADKKLRLVSILPGSEVGVPAGEFNLGASSKHAISQDGSRITWKAPGGGLYLRDVNKEETVRLDAIRGGSGEGRVEPAFAAASSDGSKVFFTDSQELTKDSGAENRERRDLYKCEIVEIEGKLACFLSDLTPASSGRSAGVQGYTLGVSEDGSYVYFVANGVLGDGAEHGAKVGNCHTKETQGQGECNLYLWHDGKTQLVAVVSGEDYPNWGVFGTAETQISQQPTSLSHNGRYLAFMSSRSLTGYDNHDVNSGKPDEEVFLFDARNARIVCASCNPTGARPVGYESGTESEINPELIHGVKRLTQEENWPSTTWIAAQVPRHTGGGITQPRYLSDAGRLFFEGSDALAPQDINGNIDVYEYEPPGVGNCSASSTTYSEHSYGCIGLISSGTAHEETVFMEASEDGGDVFFLTAEKLTPQDRDTAYDIYDAHSCTNQSPCISATAPSPNCTTADACRAAPAPQPAIFGAPSSATFSGAGNTSTSTPAGVKSKSLTRAQKIARDLAACRRRYRSRAGKRAACERRVKKKYRATKSAKANATKRGQG
jgi:hypothetical protein